MRRAWVLVTCSAAVAAGCASDSTPAAGPTSTAISPTTPAAAGATPATATAAVLQYLDALSKGDLSAADGLRCVEGRVPESSLSQLGTVTAPLKELVGGTFNATSLQVVDPITLASLSGDKPDVQVAFGLATESGSSSLLAVAVVTEDGQPRLCGSMQEGAPAVMNRVDAAEFTPVLAQVTNLSVGIPPDPIPGAKQLEDRAMTDLSSVPGATEGHTRAWGLPEAGGLRITALRSENFQGAIALARASLAASGLDAAEFLDDLPSGFKGISEVADSWTWVHPASLGDRNDVAAGVVNDVAFVVAVSGPAAGGDHQTLIDAVTALALG